MRRFLSALFACALAFSASPVLASDQTIWYPQQTATSQGLNGQARANRVALGSFVMQALGLTGVGVGGGTYANLTATAATGLFVTIGPSVTGTNGMLFQVMADDTATLPAACPGPIVSCVPLPADPTLIAPPSFQTASSNPIGPLTAPGTSGQSVYWLIEASAARNDTNSQNAQFLLAAGPQPVYVPGTYPVNLTRTDLISYQTKQGTASTSDCNTTFPTKPTADSGWIAISYVCISNGISQVTSGMISAAAPFAGFSPYSSIIGTGNITTALSGTSLSIGEVSSPTWSGTATATGGFASGSSSYGPTSTKVNGALGVDGNSAPSFGFKCGTSSQSCDFVTPANTTSGAAFVFSNPSCSGSNLDIAQWLNNATLESYIGCDGDYTANMASSNSVELGGSNALMATTGTIETQNGQLVALATGIGAPTGLTAGGIYSATALGGGLISFGTTGVGAHICSQLWAYPNMSLGCDLQVTGAAGSVPSISAGDLSANETASAGALYLGGSTTVDKIDFGLTTSGVETHSQPETAQNIKDLGALGVDGNAYPANGFACGVAGTTACLYKATTNSTTTTGHVFDSTTACHAGTDTYFNIKVNGTGQASFDCSGDLSAGAVTATNVKNTGLSTSTSTPICGGNTGNETQCVAQGPLFSTTGNVNHATGTTANTYQQLGGNISVTMPAVSYGTNHEWIATVEMLFGGGGTAVTGVYGCIASSSTFTLQDGTTDGASTCVTALTGSMAGSGPMSGTGFTQIVKATAIIANSAVFTANCNVAGSTTTSYTLYGYCHVIVAPY